MKKNPAKKSKLRPHEKDLRWEKLDNTAHLFPIIAGDKTSNVYRISVTLRDAVQPDLLQDALNTVLPKFKGFDLRLRKGIFWNYFEENGKPAPKVLPENDFPCRRIMQNRNRSYLFRVTYFDRRINLEVFHALTDGMGGITFLKELTYQYLRLAHPELSSDSGDFLVPSTSLNRSDSFLNHYRKAHKKEYQTHRACSLRGESFLPGKLGIIHAKIPLGRLKEVCEAYQVSVNEYLVSAFIWSVYQEYLHGVPGKYPIRISVPVNLRPYFGSVTTKNFFVMVAAEFDPREEHGPYSFEEVTQIIRDSLRSQMNKEHLENLFSYNVSNELNILLRAIPLFLKSFFMRHVYNTSARAHTSTITNIGKIVVEEPYSPYIESFYGLLPLSKGQNLRTAICTYNNTVTVTFTSSLLDPMIQRGFFRRLTADHIPSELESNGVYYE